MRAQFRRRIRYILIGISLLTIVIVGRLAWVQIVHGASYGAKVDAQVAANTTSGLFDRGTIYFTREDGSLISAATLEDGFLVAINPQLLGDPGSAYAAITAAAASTTGSVVSRDTFMADAAKTNQVYIEVAHGLPTAAGNALATEAIPGVQVLHERWRYYPGGTLAANTLGIVSYGSGTVLTGQTGLEDEYNDVLTRSGSGLYQNFFAQLFSNLDDSLVTPSQEREGNVITTIEPEVEMRLEDDIQKVNERYSSQETGGIIMDPHTGAIIALASYPSFDPNDLSSIDPNLLRNPLVERVYEFGSIMKPLTMAAGLDAGVITPDSTYYDTGCITVDKAKICNFDKRARGTTPMLQVIEQSLNVGASWIATQLGQAQFRTYFMKYFGQKTGIDLPREIGGLIGGLSTAQQVNFDTMSFGQGIAVTPMQMVRALAALANGGVMVSPHVGKEIVYDSGKTQELDWSTTTQLFSAQTAQEVTQMLETVYPNDAKLAMNADPTLQYANVPVAAKTGTAQAEKPGGGYYTNVFFHSFYGFFPANNPRFVILLYTNHPQGVEYASETLTGTFMDLTDFLINYYHIPPDPSGVLPLPKVVTE